MRAFRCFQQRTFDDLPASGAGTDGGLMRIFGILPKEFWENDRLRKLSATTRLVAVYLHAGPHSTVIGCYRIPLAYVAEDLNFSLRHVKKAMAELTEISFLRFDLTSNYVEITNFLSTRARKWLANPKNRISAARALEEIPDTVPFKEEIRRQLLEIKEPAPINDTIDDQSTIDQRSIKGNRKEKEERKGKEDRYGNIYRDGNAPSAPASPDHFSCFQSFPKSLSFPLKDGTQFEVDAMLADQWQSHFPNIVVPAQLQKYHQWFVKNINKRMNRKGTETALLKFLTQDNEKAKP
jgi:hypothetical protein